MEEINERFFNAFENAKIGQEDKITLMELKTVLEAFDRNYKGTDFIEEKDRINKVAKMLILSNGIEDKKTRGLLLNFTYHMYSAMTDQLLSGYEYEQIDDKISRAGMLKLRDYFNEINKEKKMIKN